MVFSTMNARINVLRALQKTARLLRGSKDPHEAIEAAREEIRLEEEITELQRAEEAV